MLTSSDSQSVTLSQVNADLAATSGEADTPQNLKFVSQFTACSPASQQVANSRRAISFPECFSGYLRQAENWSGVPLRWMLRRIGYAAALAAWVGMAMALVVVTGHHEVVTVCTETACTP